MKRNHLTALFAATVIIASGCGSDSKDPVSSDPGLTETDGPSTTFTHRVLFSLTEGSVSPIYAADASGANRQQLTSGWLDRQPQGSPDGTAIVFGRGDSGREDLWRMAADGTGAVKLTAAPGSHTEPQWSPDGTRIVFKSDRDGQTEIYVMNSDGTGQTRLTDNSSLDAHPSWSPDGSRIVWASDRDAGDTPLNFEIYVMDSDGANIVRLTRDDHLDVMPNWSPDGESIVFASNRHGALTADAEIYVMSSIGATPDQYRVTHLLSEVVSRRLAHRLHPTGGVTAAGLRYAGQRHGAHQCVQRGHRQRLGRLAVRRVAAVFLQQRPCRRAAPELGGGSRPSLCYQPT